MKRNASREAPSPTVKRRRAVGSALSLESAIERALESLADGFATGKAPARFTSRVTAITIDSVRNGSEAHDHYTVTLTGQHAK